MAGPLPGPEADEATCPACGRGAWRARRVLCVRGHLLEVCDTCGTWRARRQGALPDYQDYFDDYQAGLQETAEQAALVRYHRSHLSRIAHLVPAGGTMLDIGCGLGHGLLAAAGLGWSPHGHDVSPAATAWIEHQYGFPTASGPLDAGRFGTQRFDVVYVCHVLEHTADPVHFLHEIAGRLAPGGVLVVAVPNVGAAARSLAGEDWIAWHLPFHAWFFTKRGLDGTLRRSGYKPRSVRSGTRPGEYWPLGLLADKRITRAGGMPYPDALPLKVARAAARLVRPLPTAIRGRLCGIAEHILDPVFATIGVGNELVATATRIGESKRL